MELPRFASFSWVSFLEELTGKEQLPIKLTVLETIAFQPATSEVDVWAYTDSTGILRRHDRKTLLKADLLSCCLRSVLTPSELDLYHSEVSSFSSSDSMVTQT